MKTGLLIGLISFALSVSAFGKEPTGLKSDKQKFSYTVGFQIGQNLKRQNLDLDTKAFSQGAQDALSNTTPRMKNEEMQAAIQSQQKKEAEKQEALMKKNLEAGQAFLESNKKKEGVVTLPSGVQYKIIAEGKGKQPTAADTVIAHYRGTLINGTEFDSSYKRKEPTEFPLSGVIPCWTEGVQMMKAGGKARLTCPPETAYGERGAGGVIPPNATLTFEVELLEVKATAKPPATTR